MKKRLAFPRRLICVLAAVLLLFPAAAVGGEEPDPAAILASMPTEQKIAQLLVPSFYYRFDRGAQENVTEVYPGLEELLRKYGFGGIIFSIWNTKDTEQTVRLADAMQSVSSSVPGRPRLFFCTDQEGGTVTRFGHGTQMPGSMALGAINDPDVTRSAGRLIGSEVTAIGLNGTFAPVADVNVNPSNPIIGVRSFSDDAWTAAVHASAMVRGLHEAGSLAVAKHFPGHGDTDTDSHTGLPLVDKSYEDLKALELIPFKAAIDAGADMVMTAHIVYPQIEKGTYTSVSTGETIGLPATLSRTFLTDILRGEMGYEGLIVTDAMNMDAIAKHFDPLDSAKMAIEAGADLILMPVDYRDPDHLNKLDRYIRDAAAWADEGRISMDALDAAVLHVLTFKHQHGMLVSRENTDTEGIIQYALQTVGSREHHEEEFGIAKRAVTLLKDSGVLPLNTAESAVILVPYDSQVKSASYAVGRLQDEGKLPRDVRIPVYVLSKLTEGKLQEICESTRHILAVHAMYGTGDLNGTDAALIDTVIAAAHQAGNDVTVVSAQLPYDAARFQDADAIIAVYNARGMSQDPRDTEEAAEEYGPNLPAGLYMLLSGEKMTGRLPVAVPALDENHSFTGEILYFRGFGL